MVSTTDVSMWIPAWTRRRRFDRLPNYYDDSTQKKLDISLVNGGYYCTPTSALSLVRYWAADPRFPKLFDPTNGDTDRSVILEMARLMDTDDLVDRGGADNQENHHGTLIGDVLPGMFAYFNARYPNKFKSGDKVLPANADTDDYNNDFGAKYDASILRNIPVILELPGHSTVGIGFDDGFARETKSHYRLNDPWNAQANITAGQVGKGRPIAARGVFGSEVEDLFGPGADSEYDESPSGPSQSGLPFAMHWVEPLEDAETPEPSSACLAFAAATCGLLTRTARTTNRR